jgi:hypothetical protein
VFVILIAHFFGYIIYFGLDLVLLLDIGSIARFSFGAFVFISVFIAFGRMMALIIWKSILPHSTRERMNGAIISIFSWAIPTNFLTSAKRMDIGPVLIGYTVGFLAFAVTYLGMDRTFLFFLFIAVYHIIMFAVIIIRSTIFQHKFTSEVSSFAFGKILPFSLIFFAVAAGNLRADHNISTKLYSVVLASQGLECEAATDTTKGTIVLTSTTGFLLYVHERKDVIFVSWERGNYICSTEQIGSKRSVFDFVPYFGSGGNDTDG